MKKAQALELAAEHNRLLKEGNAIYAALKVSAERVVEIRDELRAAGIEFDEIALIFGEDLEPDGGWENEH